MSLETQLNLNRYPVLSKEHFDSIQNRGFVKPNGGLWSSTFKVNGEYLSGWDEFCKEDFNKGLNPYKILFDISPEARIYTIDSQRDLKKLILKYGYHDDGSIKFFKDAGIEPFALYPNFENIQKDYDVIHLTEKGQWETRMPREDRAYNLYGWDVESSLIMHFEAIEGQRLLETEEK